MARDHLPEDHVAHGKGVRRGLSPHLFRDCLATSLAINDPGIVNIAHVMLGNSLATTERFYNLAQTLEAGRLVGDTLARLRSKIQAA
jgi:integrase/recombinase XerC